MSQPPFGIGNRVLTLDNVYNERAPPPRMSFDRQHHHPVVPIQRSRAPHYAQAAQLYPMRTSSDRDMYRYQPCSGLSSSPTGGPGNNQQGQAVFIPVVHLGADGATRGSGQRDYNTGALGRSYNAPRTMGTNDPEAEVDALTNVLYQCMEPRTPGSFSSTRPSGGCTTPTPLNSDVGSASPVGSLNRGVGVSGLPSTFMTSNRINRLQQEANVRPSSPTSVLLANGGHGSPLVVARTDSPTLDSPTSSIANAEAWSNVTCYRCRSPLVPPEGSTLAPVTPSQASANVVSLTGALAVRLHTRCFTCYRCSAPLQLDAYYHSQRSLYCSSCVRDGLVETCSNCNRPIGERIVRALGLPYHPACFVCAVCNCRLDSKPFTVDVLGRPHCLDDFHRRYAPRCAVCSRAIAPEAGSQEARRVVAGDSDYHMACYDQTQVALGQQSGLPQQPTSVRS